MNRVIKQRRVVCVYCEGESEMRLFGFLKSRYSNRIMNFSGPKDISGFSDFKVFKQKYWKLMRAFELKPKNDFSGLKILFIIDGDLDDSEKNL